MLQGIYIILGVEMLLDVHYMESCNTNAMKRLDKIRLTGVHSPYIIGLKVYNLVCVLGGRSSFLCLLFPLPV